MEKHDTESTRNTKGERLSQIRTHQGTWCPGERLKKKQSEEDVTLLLILTYYTDCFHVDPRRLLTAAAMLKTIDVNQNPLTASAVPVPTFWYEYCRVVAVTAEKNVAIVERFKKLLAPCCCANRMVGIPASRIKGRILGNAMDLWT